MTLDRSISPKESVEGSPRAGLQSALDVSPPGESLLIGRRSSAVSPRSLIDAARAGERVGFANQSNPTLGGGERPSELLRLPLVQTLESVSLLVWLVVLKADDRPSGTLIQLRPYLWARGEVTIGREAADLKFDNQALSKTHLEIRLDESGQGYLVRDLGSTNGSFLAADPYAPFTQLTAPQPLRDGNALRLGDVVLVFRCFRGSACI